MALEKRISELTAKSGQIEDTDLLVISDYNGVDYDTKSVTGAQIRPFKTYLANISQTGTSAPTLNYGYSTELNSAISWSYVSTGIYEATLSTEELVNNKTFLSLNLGLGVVGFYSILIISTTVFRIKTYDISGALANSMLENSFVEIKIIK